MAKKAHTIIRIALIGPESTAKSTLSEALAKHYQTVWVKEYAREYLQNKIGNYNLEDIIEITKHQLLIENKLIEEANKYIFVDTELIISKVWCEDVFQSCPAWIEKSIVENKYDLYLLTFPDILWIADPLRENPSRREFFFDWYERELNSIQANYTVIKGVGNSRLQNSIDAIENFVRKIKN